MQKFRASTTTHKIGVNYFQVVNIEETYLNNLKITASPNPFDEVTIISLNGVKFEKGEWALYEIFGRKVKSDDFSGNAFQITSTGLNDGTYFLKILLDDVLAGTGKITVSK